MSINHIAMTETIPSSGMPVYGRALGAAVGIDVCATQTTAVVLRARVVGIKGGFPGTSAWRPPSR